MTPADLGEILFWVGVVFGTAMSLSATALVVILGAYFTRRS